MIKKVLKLFCATLLVLVISFSYVLPSSAYEVQKGDTLSKITKAEGNGLTVAEVAKLNNIKNVNMIVPGQIIVMPSDLNYGDCIDSIQSQMQSAVYDSYKNSVGAYLQMNKEMMDSYAKMLMQSSGTNSQLNSEEIGANIQTIENAKKAGVNAFYNNNDTSTPSDTGVYFTFDSQYYAANNPDVVAEVGDSSEALYNHFAEFGFYEGRQPNASFNVNVYYSANSDLQERTKDMSYAERILFLYNHYIEQGKNEPRYITTLEQAKAAGITVISAVDRETIIQEAPAPEPTPAPISPDMPPLD